MFGVIAIVPLVFAGAVSGAPPVFLASPGVDNHHAKAPAVHAAVTPVAAVSPTNQDLSGPTVIAVVRPPTGFHVAAATISAPPPPMIVNSPGALGIPTVALSAYRNAELKMAAAEPGCGISWNLLAGIGRIESGHANGGAVDARGTALQPIYGPTLDGTLPGNEIIVQSGAGNRPTYARAMGPMQFLPGTWARYASDGDGDGVADPQNVYDSTLAAARYLCSGGLNLREQAQVMAAILRYNNSVPYAQNVLGWAAAYATGVVPVDLPAITGPPPPIGDTFLEHPEGLGPNLPMNVNGLPVDDPMARVPMIDFGPQLTGAQPQWPWLPQTVPNPAAPTRVPGCTLICISSQLPPDATAPGAGQLPVGGIVVAPPAPAAPPFGAPPFPAPPFPAAPPAPDPFAPPPAPAAPSAPAPAAPRATPSPKPAGPAQPQPAPAPAEPAPAPAG